LKVKQILTQRALSTTQNSLVLPLSRAASEDFFLKGVGSELQGIQGIHAGGGAKGPWSWSFAFKSHLAQPCTRHHSPGPTLPLRPTVLEAPVAAGVSHCPFFSSRVDACGNSLWLLRAGTLQLRTSMQRSWGLAGCAEATRPMPAGQCQGVAGLWIFRTVDLPGMNPASLRNSPPLGILQQAVGKKPGISHLGVCPSIHPPIHLFHHLSTPLPKPLPSHPVIYHPKSLPSSLPFIHHPSITHSLIYFHLSVSVHPSIHLFFYSFIHLNQIHSDQDCFSTPSCRIKEVTAE
jgi:hypothetical protein